MGYATFEMTGGSGDLARKVIVPGDVRSELPETGGRHLLVRCFNKKPEDIAGLLKRCRERIDPYFPLSSILVVIDPDKDRELKADTYAAVMDNRDERLAPTIPILVSGPSTIPNWTRKLNGGLAFLKASGVRDGQLIGMSFDSVPSNPEVLQNLPDAQIPLLAVRDTPAPYAPERTLQFLAQDNQVIRQHVEGILSTLREAILNNNPHISEEALDILPAVIRNTLTVWKLDPLFKTGGFDPYANIAGGQEDTAKAIELALGEDPIFPFGLSILRYEDTRFQNAKPSTALGSSETHQEKFGRERQATKKMHARLLQTGGVIPVEERDFQW